MGHSIIQTIFLALFHEFKLLHFSIIFLSIIILLTSLTFLLSDSFSFIITIYLF